MVKANLKERTYNCNRSTKFRITIVAICIMFVGFTQIIDSCLAAPHTPKAGSPERKAILDALRKPVEKVAKQKVIFYDVKIRVESNWAYVGAISKDRAGKKLVLGDSVTSALLQRKSGIWQVLYWGTERDISVTYEAARRYPQAPRAIFGLPESDLPPPAALESAMRTFISALKNKNSTSFLTLVSKPKGLRSVDTSSDGKKMVTIVLGTVSYTRLKSDLSKKVGMYGTLFRGWDESGNGFQTIIKDTKGAMWKKVGTNKFAPSFRQDENVWVKWRKEGSKWVISELSYHLP